MQDPPRGEEKLLTRRDIASQIGHYRELRSSATQLCKVRILSKIYYIMLILRATLTDRYFSAKRIVYHAENKTRWRRLDSIAI